MRINKYISSSGITSRRKADELILKRKVKVNGVIMDYLGYDVKDDDEVSVNGEIIGKTDKLYYYLLNKPIGVLSSVTDDRGRTTVVDIMDDVTVRLYPVGRLDYNTSGALIMTNDGELANHVMHPRNQVFKTYRAKVNGLFSEEKAKILRRGVKLKGYVSSPAKVNIIKQDKNTSLIEVSISEGKYHEVRDMLKEVGNPVMELERVSIGNIKLGRLLPGHYRKLSREEIEYLKNV